MKKVSKQKNYKSDKWMLSNVSQNSRNYAREMAKKEKETIGEWIDNLIMSSHLILAKRAVDSEFQTEYLNNNPPKKRSWWKTWTTS